MKTTQKFETINVQGRDVPLVNAFNRLGQAVPLRGTKAPEACAHTGATWSSDLDMRCPRCGGRLFLPPKMLARLPEEQLETMYRLWQAAGCPPWYGSAWGIVPEYWFTVEHPLFVGLTGGLPVANRNAIRFAEAVGALP